MLRRRVLLEARVREVLKTPPDRRITPSLELQVTQRQPADGFIADDYGPWSEVDLRGGIELLLFANDPKPQAPLEQVLADGCGLLIKVPNPQVPFAVEDVRRALAWEAIAGRRLLSSAQIRLAINEARASSGPLMASYLVESIAGDDLSDPVAAQGHEFLIELLQAADADVRFRLPILTHEVNELAMAQAPPVWFRARLVAAMIHILSQENADLLQEPIRQAYLVNSVLDAKGQQLLAARDVLATDAERAAFESVLRKRGFTPAQEAQLIRWARARTQ